MASSTLLTHALALAGQLDAPSALEELLAAARTHTGATYAAIAVLDPYGETNTFMHRGMSSEVVAALPHPPRGHGVLSAIPADGVLVLDDLTAAPEFEGFPAGHPPMRTFLGASVSVGDVLLGRLYLTEKPGGFTDEDVETVELLAAAAGIAIENARLYGEAARRERWRSVSQEITAALLEGSDEEEVLPLVARRLREAADADTAVIVLPSLDGAWVAEIVDGVGAADLVGSALPPSGPAMETLRTGAGKLVDSISREADRFIPQARRFERALYAPLRASRADDDAPSLGVLILFRLPGRLPFTGGDLAIAEDVAAQAALALRLAAARHAEDVATLLGERARIARDLHDLAIQQLFATGMRLERAATTAAAAERALIEESIADVDESVRQIRGIVRSLRDRDEHLPVVERLVQEASIARTALGFAPSMLLTLDGAPMHDVEPRGDAATEIAARLGEQAADDVVAVVREGLANVARHARATSAQVEVAVEPRQVRVVVTDDGVGPDPDPERRSGLANLEARARDAHGSSRLTPGPGGRGSVLRWAALLD
ncbi:GAF domain-containing sensor histidine kinase [Beutenbergia cavernae]|nr:GAF domain-containing protein [Beutenbergia cavernae]